jgi:alkylhydroperoxidase family enzyme
LREAGAARGRLINIYRAMANRPEALSAFTTMLTTVYRKDSTLPPKQAELAYLTATTVNNCFY